MSKPYILALASWFPDADTPSHGIFNFYIIKALSQVARVKVLYVKAQHTQKLTVKQRQTLQDGIEIEYYYYPRPVVQLPLLSSIIQALRYKTTWAKALKHFFATHGTPAAVQMHIAFPLIIGIKPFLKAHRLPLVLSENWSGYCVEDGNYKGLFKTWFTRYAISRSAAVVTSSNYLKSAMLKHGLNARYLVIPNPVSIQNYNSAITKPSGKKRFVHISSFTQREKNIKGLLDACLMLKNSELEFELECIGYGDEWPIWKSYSETLHLQNHVRFSGYQNAAYIMQSLHQATALVMFSFFETFSVVIPEALACGTPVICSAAGEIGRAHV